MLAIAACVAGTPIFTGTLKKGSAPIWRAEKNALAHEKRWRVPPIFTGALKKNSAPSWRAEKNALAHEKRGRPLAQGLKLGTMLLMSGIVPILSGVWKGSWTKS